MMLTDMPIVTAGGGFPWGFLIIGIILYVLWQKGMFDGRGRHGGWRDGGGPGPGNGGGYSGYGPGPGYGQPHAPEAQGQGGYDAQRQAFEAWHRQSHEAERAQAQQPAPPAAPQAPTTPPAQAPEAPAQGTGETPR